MNKLIFSEELVTAGTFYSGLGRSDSVVGGYFVSHVYFGPGQVGVSWPALSVLAFCGNRNLGVMRFRKYC
jgi:hypothetical protein